jgi:hypothetical protein
MVNNKDSFNNATFSYSHAYNKELLEQDRDDGEIERDEKGLIVKTYHRRTKLFTKYALCRVVF